MELTYDEVGLHELGEISLSQRREFEGGENPYRVRVQLTVTLRFWESTFADNYDLVRQARAALDVQHGLLTWKDDETQTVWINTPATVESMDWPEDPNGWGRYEQRAVVTFQFYEQNLTNGSAVATLSFGTNNTIALPQLNVWREQYSAERFSTLRSQRRTALIRVTASGVAMADPALSPADRRAALEAQRTDWKTKVVAAKDGLLTFGGFSQTVRIESLDMEADQAGLLMSWSLTAYFTAHPDEAGYSIAEYSVSDRNGTDMGACGTGEMFQSLTGRVEAHTEVAAKTRINEIRAAVVGATGQIQDTEAESRTVSGLDGTTFIERSFRITVRTWRVDNVAVTFKKTGNLAALNLGRVSGFSQRYSAQRFDGMRSHRQQSAGRMDVKGTIFTDTQDGATVSQRGTLVSRLQNLIAEVNGADGTLSYGSFFSKVVRVDDFSAELNQTVNGIDWTMSCSYSEFPNETGYATVEFTATTRENQEDGDAFLSFTGRVQAQSLAAAHLKLDAVRTATLAQHGFALGQRLSQQAGSSSVIANGDKTASLAEAGDGTTFLELSFTEEYRKRIAAVLTYSLRRSDSEEVRSGMIVTTFSGQVTASGASVAAAYATALAKAELLGANKYPFLTRSVVSFDERLATTTGTAEFVRLEFSYEYQRKGTRVYLELNGSVSVQAFENDRELVSGFLAAPDEFSAQSLYLLVRADYDGRLVMAEETSVSTQTSGSDALGFESQFARLDFRLEVFRAKGEGTVSIRYELDTVKEWTALMQTITVQGVCIAADRSTAVLVLDGFLGTLGLAGSPVRTQRTESFGRTDIGTTFFQVAFAEVYSTRLTGVTGILECAVTEDVQYSATRWVPQEIPRNSNGSGGVSIVQDCGVEAGRRTVRGNVVAATLAAAQSWANDQRALLTGDQDGNSYPLPEQIATDYDFDPRVTGVVNGAGANVRAFRVGFAFGELLPNYPYGGFEPAFALASVGTTSGLKSRAVVIENPTASDRVSLGITAGPMTVRLIRSFVIGVGTAVQWQLRYDMDPSGVGTPVVAVIETEEADGVLRTDALINPVIPEGAVIWLQTSGMTGTPGELCVNLEYV